MFLWNRVEIKFCITYINLSAHSTYIRYMYICMCVCVLGVSVCACVGVCVYYAYAKFKFIKQILHLFYFIHIVFFLVSVYINYIHIFLVHVFIYISIYV